MPQKSKNQTQKQSQNVIIINDVKPKKRKPKRKVQQSQLKPQIPTFYNPNLKVLDNTLFSPNVQPVIIPNNDDKLTTNLLLQKILNKQNKIAAKPEISVQTTTPNRQPVPIKQERAEPVPIKQEPSLSLPVQPEIKPEIKPLQMISPFYQSLIGQAFSTPTKKKPENNEKINKAAQLIQNNYRMKNARDDMNMRIVDVQNILNRYAPITSDPLTVERPVGSRGFPVNPRRSEAAKLAWQKRKENERLRKISDMDKID